MAESTYIIMGDVVCQHLIYTVYFRSYQNDKKNHHIHVQKVTVR